MRLCAVAAVVETRGSPIGSPDRVGEHKSNRADPLPPYPQVTGPRFGLAQGASFPFLDVRLLVTAVSYVCVTATIAVVYLLRHSSKLAASMMVSGLFIRLDKGTH